MDMIDTIAPDNEKEAYSKISEKSWVPPTLICIPLSSTMNNLSGSGDGDSALANS